MPPLGIKIASDRRPFITGINYIRRMFHRDRISKPRTLGIPITFIDILVRVLVAVPQIVWSDASIPIKPVVEGNLICRVWVSRRLVDVPGSLQLPPVNPHIFYTVFPRPAAKSAFRERLCILGPDVRVCQASPVVLLENIFDVFRDGEISRIFPVDDAIDFLALHENGISASREFTVREDIEGLGAESVHLRVLKGGSEGLKSAKEGGRIGPSRDRTRDQMV